MATEKRLLHVKNETKHCPTPSPQLHPICDLFHLLILAITVSLRLYSLQNVTETFLQEKHFDSLLTHRRTGQNPRSPFQIEPVESIFYLKYLVQEHF